MEKRNKLVLTGIIIVTLIVLGVCIYSLITDKLEISDASKFRTEYMELNDKVNESLDVLYPTVSISENNTVKYTTPKDLVKLLESGTGVIYIGFPTCPWCRTLVPILTSLAEEKNEIIYYADISDIKSIFKVSKGKVKQTKSGSKEYYRMLELLDEFLEDYSITDDENNSYLTGEKRIYNPTLIAVNNGKITSVHVGTVSSQTSGYDKLNDEQVKELTKTIRDLINSKNTESCVQDIC